MGIVIQEFSFIKWRNNNCEALRRILNKKNMSINFSCLLSSRKGHHFCEVWCKRQVCDVKTPRSSCQRGLKTQK